MLIVVLLSVVLGVAFGELCPGGKWTCSTSMTCCELPSGEQGCCPYPNASCCRDHVHCCPSGWDCDPASDGSCRPAYDKSHSAYIAAVPSPDVAGDPRFCCSTVGIDMDCTPAVGPCPPGDTGCGRDGVCDLGLSDKLGMSNRMLREWIANAKLTAVTNTCTGPMTQCLPGSACRPIENMHKTDPAAASKSILNAFIGNSSVTGQCPGGTAQCPDDNTCCQLTSGQWGCCPMENAVCCADKEHCCPPAYHCLASGAGCGKNEEVDRLN